MTNNKQQYIQTLPIVTLLNSDQYIIPIYQRNYAWGNDEIETLINDMINVMERDSESPYYIGSLVVFKRHDEQFEVIDGQQRLTTLSILSAYLKQKSLLDDTKALFPLKRNTGFEYREDSERALKSLFSVSSELPSNFQAAIDALERHWPRSRDKSQELASFLLHKVHIIRTEVPPETDLNHYFEIMNTRGEQLAKHEVLKARLMSRLSEHKHEQSAFAVIWDACSDMNRYMVLGIPSNVRKKIFGDNWQSMPQCFDSFSEELTQKADDTESKSILDIIQDNHQNEARTEIETSERFNSVIDFPNLLMHVLKIFNHDNHLGINAREIALDEKTLLDRFTVLEQQSVDEIKRFALVLCRCRYLFDKYIIKADTSKEQDDHWSLLTVKPREKNSSSYQYNNTFLDNKNVELLLSMFHVSHPSRIYKNWLYAVLRWLYAKFTPNQIEIELKEKDYITFLEDLSDRYYFGHYGNGDDFFDLINQEEFVRPNYQSREEMPKSLQDMLKSGTAIPNFIFNRLDYLLWQKEPKNFRFTFRSSVEHFYPQTPPEKNERLPNDILHCLGNLCLISQSHNSRFTNNMPKAKLANFGHIEHNSLKLEVMMKEADTWGIESIEKHHDEMVKVLNKQ